VQEDGIMARTDIPAWLDKAQIIAALENTQAPKMDELQAIFAKSLSLESLNLHEISQLLAVESPEGIKALCEAAAQVKEKVYGDRIVLTAPLHISSFCGGERADMLASCVRKNRSAIAESTRNLLREGHKRVLIIAETLGEDGFDGVLEAVHTVYSVREKGSEVRRANVNLTPLRKEDYEALRDADVGSCNVYQETYDEKVYASYYGDGPKGDFVNRLEALEMALAAGLQDVGLGLMLGLGPWKYDVLALSLHAAHIERSFGVGVSPINLHRIAGAPVNPVSDEEYIRATAIVRLALPCAGIILNTCKAAGPWREACRYGCSQIITGSVVDPNEPAVPVKEVVRYLVQETHHMPSFCCACPRLGRCGDNFLSVVHEAGSIASQCGPNSLASFAEYLQHYAEKDITEAGMSLIQQKLDAMPQHTRGAAEKLLQKIELGRVDEFI
jgi:2-iminoacetate synthase